MKLILFLVITTVCVIGFEANMRYRQLLLKMKTMEANGQKFILDDLISFARVCIEDQTSSEVVKAEYQYMRDINNGRNLLDLSSFHCEPFSAVNSANATAPNLPQCVIPDVFPGTTLIISDCSSNCIGDQYLRLYEYETDVELVSNDDGKLSHS